MLFQRLLKRPAFSWDVMEALLRKHKPSVPVGLEYTTTLPAAS